MSYRKYLSRAKLKQYLKEIQPMVAGFEYLNDHVIVTDENANILYANKAAEENTGFSRKEMIAKNPGDLWGSNMPPDFYRKMWHRIKIENKPFVGDVLAKRKDGREYWNELKIVPILGKNLKPRFLIGIEPNITLKKRAEEFRQDITSIIGHQSRNCLVAARYTLEGMMRKGGLPKNQRDTLKKVCEYATRTVKFLNDFLVLSRIDAVLPSREAFDIGQQTKEIVALVKENHPGTHFDLQIRGAYPFTANKSLAFQVFLNLVSNAAEYSSASRGRVRIALKKQRGQYLFSVQDNGIGIPRKDQPKIFNRFFRASNAGKMKKEGTGLGLYIVKKISDYLGWKVSLKSKTGKGTTFFVVIPGRR
ncbi:MAG: hypothetical protein A2667_03095 [Candidatus Wildermuthbacteria bacterium RIFCSPHIGHO2_01_FULL_47_27]|uniref:histidine kinase n=2 Tax=Candidatus Wildermuthiibacteriota TaxID=1817923 RepID=A0A1G2RLZ3_9BACT|nr:MAG: hypothetical protein A2667_03095 [Candidatus Wildermuthbacteria bacterium RIFCSPHIGHO2_01_FULL_47_27]OHA67987.1 MAG: hypothetical protein A3D59_02535 [Candidatus Wildermuthbacteria bacterium RIFCSPHIGHO2_02_FULL_47_17]OHA73846.1 MAG: hypothetical protein A3A32_02925 [Candidatus Wildermuthbacteria bacterium RIFCSPLOWO2_01_FULL_48_35]OHA76534.1 MAG: hypothetical protein A3I38_03600 [Candidatus Wildermuthbacteria bacterium RIFCSPLOWO2_02_FULL_47_10]